MALQSRVGDGGVGMDKMRRRRFSGAQAVA